MLAALDGEPVPRKPVEPPKPVEKLCRQCRRQIVIARGSASNWAVLERREPDGSIVIVNGIARDCGDAYLDKPRFEFHRCNTGGAP